MGPRLSLADCGKGMDEEVRVLSRLDSEEEIRSLVIEWGGAESVKGPVGQYRSWRKPSY